jgi:hypothetical protein
MKLIDGEAVLVIFKAGEAPEIGVFDDGCVYIKDHDGVYAIGCSPSHCDLIPLRLARVAGEMAEALENIAKAAAQANHDAKLAKWFEESPNA